MKEHLQNVIETLYPMNACLLGEGYDNRLEFIKSLVDLEVIEFPSGTEFGTWTVPDEWIVRDAWVKLNGEKIIDYSKDPLSLVVGSTPQHGIVHLDELREHLHYSSEMPDATPYVFKFYDRDWGFCMPKNKMLIELKDTEKEFLPTGEEVFKSKIMSKLPEGDYEVFIDTEYKPGVMKLGVHTIPGKSDREILLFAHLDHPYQANDNLSAVACLLDLVNKLHVEHTIKIVFCPETIGSVAYALTQDVSKVDFMIAVDVCGNSGDILMQKSFDKEHKINRVAHLAIHSLGESYRKGEFRNTIGSDEYVFNDPLIGVPGILLSTWPYNEYHTSADTPDIIDYSQIEKIGRVVQKIIEIWEKDFIPTRNFKGQLMRSKYGIQTSSKQVNLAWDYLFYFMDGKKSVAELCSDCGLDFDFVHGIITKMVEDKYVCSNNISKKSVGKTASKNTRDFHGKPMFLVNVEKCLKIFDKVYVSSDSEHILRVAKDAGAIPIERGKGLCGQTPNITVYQHALKKMGDIEGIVAVQANSPSIKPHIICDIKELMERGYDEVMTCYDDYKIYGSVWALSTEKLLTYRDAYNPKPDILIKDSSVDIHTQEDLTKALKQYERKQQKDICDSGDWA